MHSANVPETMRRSSRVPITLPIAVTSLEPSAPFSEICETLVVSAHGCAIFSPTRLEAGIPVQFRRKLSEAGLREAYPDAGEREIFLRLAQRQLGDELFQKVYGDEWRKYGSAERNA